jgi:mRNA-degrading endonuclease toxin of MazEF toxin-antitoxin module
MRCPQRGDIRRLKSDAVGKKRPVVIVSRSILNGGVEVSAAPFYSTPNQLNRCAGKAHCVFFAAGEFGLEKDCVLKLDEAERFSVAEFLPIEPPGQLYQVSEAKMIEVSAALRYAFDCEPPA